MAETNGSDTSTNGAQSLKAKQPRLAALTLRQERKLVDYLDENFLQLTRNFKKRFEASSSLRTLAAYLEESRRLLAFILQIPPIDPSTGLRISYMLRMTGEALSSIPGYRLGSGTASTTGVGASTDVRAALQDLVDFLDDLDQAWLAVLRGQAWDPASSEGVDVSLPPSEVVMESDPAETSSAAAGSAINGVVANDDPPPVKSTPPSQTDLTRLRSLLLAGEARLEEWLTNERTLGAEDRTDEVEVEVEDISMTLERMGLLADFDSLFVRTLDYLHGFSGDIAHNVVDPEPEAEME